jgi:CRISPR system Cascade subunit CasD
MQAWGVESKFDRRDAGRAPSKSGVVGLCAAALGYGREDDRIKELSALTFGVRTDWPGRLLRDYHTAKSEKSAYVTERYYLADAAFLVGLEGDDEEFLSEIAEAICAPAFPLFLGRRSCPPEGRVFLELVPEGLEQALRDYPLLKKCGNAPDSDGQEDIRIIMDADVSGHLVRDLPESFSQLHRRFGFRRVGDAPYLGKTAVHDPILEAEEAGG